MPSFALPLVFIKSLPENAEDLMRGPWVVAPESIEEDDQLSAWIQKALKFVGKLTVR